jgi:hypothetical protein
MANGKFIVTFIAESAEKGMGAIESALSEISEIDKKLHEAEKLKIRRMNLVEVLNHFGDETYRRRRNVNVPSSDDIETSDNVHEIRSKIIAAIAAKGPLNVRDLILEVGSYDQDALIMRAVKWLGDLEVVSRDPDGKVIPGKNWENK